MPSFDTPGFIEPGIDVNETTEIRRKRLKFRSKHRGIKEADILLGWFADSYLDKLTPAQLDRYETLLREPDPKIVSWITNDQEPPEALKNDVMDMLQSLDFLKIIS